MIRFEDVTVRFPGQPEDARPAVDSLALEVRRGETLCIIGPSGCGKTTTMRLVNRLVTPTAGRVLVGGEDVQVLDPVRLRRRIGYVIQAGGLFPHLSVRQNVGLLCKLEGWSPADVRERADALLRLVRLEPGEFGDRYPARLSGGERQRVGVARALALDPEIVLMDEPFGALDPITRDELQQEFLELDTEEARTVLFVTHDMDEAFRLGDRIGLMFEGRLEQVGTLEELRDAPRSEHVTRFLETQLS